MLCSATDWADTYPNTRQASIVFTGLGVPTIIAASARYPYPPEIFSVNMEAPPMVRNAPLMPPKSPPSRMACHFVAHGVDANGGRSRLP